MLLIAALTCGGAVWLFDREVTQLDQARFRNAIQATTDRIRGRIDAYIAVMLATRSMFIANDLAVDDGQFRRFVHELALQERYPGIQGVGLTRRFDAAQRAAIEAERHREGVPEFKVWPGTPRDELHSIVFLEPLDRRNAAAIGYDMFTEPTRREAMERARDTGEPAASGPVTLVQEIDPQKQRGFLIYVPLYVGGKTPPTVEERRAKLYGFVYSPFRIEDLMVGIFGSEVQHRVTFSIRDRHAGVRELLHVAPGSVGERARFVEQADLPVAGRTWELRFESLPALEAASATWLLPYTITAAVLVTTLLFLLSLSQSRAQEQYRVHSRILDSMTEGVSVSNERGIILYTNPSEDVMFGYARGELIGKPVTVQNRYPPEENARIVAEVIAQLRERGAWMGEFRNVKKDGTEFVTAARISALQLNAESYWVCVQEDITARKQAEHEREELLQREQSLRKAAESASRAKDDFVAMISHELRNPLAPIGTAVELLAARGDTAIEREVRIIDRQVRHLGRIVDDLLDVSAITRGELALHKQPVQLADVVADAVARVASDLNDRKQQMDIDVAATGLTIDVDHERIVQVVANLLSNASKYSKSGDRIAVHAHSERGEVVVRVIDAGIGIEPEVLPTLFEPFFQGERRLERAKGGLGLGLTLVRSLVEAHGGSVEARSQGRGMGCELVVRLPASAVEAEPRVKPESRGTRKRILVVDDNADAADLLAEYLEAAGYEVRVAYDATTAIELARESPADAAILDLGLPDIDGYELASKLPGTPRPLLIAVTGYGRDGDRARTRSAGFAHHFVKPISPKLLLDALASM